MRRFTFTLALTTAFALSGCKHADVPDSSSLDAPPTQHASADRKKSKPQPELNGAKSADACVAVAKELEKARRDQEAIALYERALTFNPTRRDITHRLACLSARTGQDDIARQRFEAALRESPRDPQIMNDYGYFLFSRGEYKAAEKQQRRALKLAPKSELFQSNLAMTLAAMLKYDEALEVFEHTVGPAAARSNLAVLMARNGDKARAQEMLRDAQVIDPSITQAEVVAEFLTSGTKRQEHSQVLPASFATQEELD